MVRNYKPRNRLYRKSKLSEDQVARALAFTLALAPNWKISERTGISEKSLKILQHKYSIHLVESERFRRYCLEHLLKFDVITKDLYLFLLNEPYKRPVSYWLKLEDCVFRCPKMITFRATQKGLSRFLERNRATISPWRDAEIALRVHEYANGADMQKRVPCVGCKYIESCGINESYRNLHFWSINNYYECRSLRKRDLKTHFLPSFFSFFFYVESMKELGVHYPVESPEKLPNFPTQASFAQALIPPLVRNTFAFVYSTCDGLIDDPI